MDKTFKIEKEQVNKLAFRDIKSKGIIGLATITFTFSYLITMIKSSNIPTLHNPERIIILSVSIPIVLFGLITWNSYKFKKIFYDNYLIEINDTIIRKYINLENNSKLSGLDKMNWDKAKRLYPQNDISIEWEKINKIEEKKYGLWLKTENANNFFGSGQVIIPREIEKYEELKQIINEKRKNYR
jgi:hypothetical protein